jgi:hypothetical protein
MPDLQAGLFLRGLPGLADSPGRCADAHHGGVGHRVARRREPDGLAIGQPAMTGSAAMTVLLMFAASSGVALIVRWADGVEERQAHRSLDGFP